MTDTLAFDCAIGAAIAGPRRRARHRRGDDATNDSVNRIEDTPVDIEREAPIEDNASEQRVEPDDKSPPAPFEE